MRTTNRLTSLTMLAITMASMWIVGNAQDNTDPVVYQPVSVSGSR